MKRVSTAQVPVLSFIWLQTLTLLVSNDNSREFLPYNEVSEAYLNAYTVYKKVNWRSFMKRAYTCTNITEHVQGFIWFQSPTLKKKLPFVMPLVALNYLAAFSLCKNAIWRTPFTTACSDYI